MTVLNDELVTAGGLMKNNEAVIRRLFRSLPKSMSAATESVKFSHGKYRIAGYF